MTSLQYLLELQRDWARAETYGFTTGLAGESGGAYGIGIDTVMAAVRSESVARTMAALDRELKRGEWVLRRACLDGLAWPGLTVAVNVSPLPFRRANNRLLMGCPSAVATTPDSSLAARYSLESYPVAARKLRAAAASMPTVR